MVYFDTDKGVFFRTGQCKNSTRLKRLKRVEFLCFLVLSVLCCEGTILITR